MLLFQHILLKNILRKITTRSICMWYLDDGTLSGNYKRWGWGKSEISATKLDYSSKQKLANHCMNIGLPIPTITERGFLFSGKRNKEFHKAIAKYTPKCMEYKRNDNVNFYSELSADQMRDLMLKCDLAISSAGQTSYEIYQTGLRSILIQVVDNQKSNINGFYDMGVINRISNIYEDDYLSKIVRSIEEVKVKKNYYVRING